MTVPEFDVFVSYSAQDLPQAREIVDRLKAAKFRVWFAPETLPPGSIWISELLAGIAVSKATIVLIGHDGLKPWMQEEVRIAFDMTLRGNHKIIPVLLPTAPDVSEALESIPFLAQRQVLDCRVLHVQHIVDQVIWGLTGRKPTLHLTQAGREFSLVHRRPDQTERTLSLYTLPNANPDALLLLSWHTFGDCVEKLAHQIRNYGWRLGVDACIGINDAGLVMATFLNSHVLGRAKLGYLRGGAGIKNFSALSTDGSFLPSLPERPTVLIADFELKSGRALKLVSDRLRQEYKNPSLYFATCGARTSSADLAISAVDKLEAFALLGEAQIQDIFIAATMGSPGIEPPLGLR